MGSIPASQLVNVVPSVLSAGGTGLALNGLFLTQSTRAPIGAVLPFPTAAAVGAYFGLSSLEYALAGIYFGGFNGSNIKPGSLLFTQYNEAAVPAWLRGGSVASMPLASLLALAGPLNITIDGHAFAVANVSLAAATSFSSAAALLTTALDAAAPQGSAVPVVQFDSISGAFTVQSGSSGTASSITFANGTLAAPLGLASTSGGVLSQGAAPAVPGTFMASLINGFTNFASFATAWECSLAEGEAFAAWNTAQGNRFLFAAWNTDANNAVSGSTSTLAYAIGPNGSNSSGTAVIYAPTNGALTAAFLLGYVASLDFTETNGRATAAYKTVSGLAADVSTGTAAANLQANGVNFHGAFATANEVFTFFYPGSVTGPYAWIDSYVNQVWLTNQLQLAITNGLTQSKSVPYAAPGYALITAWLTDPVQQGLDFGAIVPGVALSAAQVAAIETATGVKGSARVVVNQGYFLQVRPASAQTRAARQSPPCTLFYADGGSVQSISLASIEVQ